MNALLKLWNPDNLKLQTRNCKLQYAVSHETPDAKGLHYFSVTFKANGKRRIQFKLRISQNRK